MDVRKIPFLKKCKKCNEEFRAFSPNTLYCNSCKEEKEINRKREKRKYIFKNPPINTEVLQRIDETTLNLINDLKKLYEEIPKQSGELGYGLEMVKQLRKMEKEMQKKMFLYKKEHQTATEQSINKIKWIRKKFNLDYQFSS